MLERISFYIYGLPSFFAYFALAACMLCLFMVVYSKLTPHHEWTLIKNGNQAASVAFSGAAIGFCLPLYSAMNSALSILDFALWSVISMLVQLMAFYFIKLILKLQKESLSSHISEGHLAYGILVGTISIAAGILNAASMSY